MSGIYNEMQEGGYNEVLSRRFNMKISAPAPALVPEVGAGIIVENDRFEWGFLKRENAYSLQGFQAAVVGQKSFVRLSNISSNTIAVIDSLTLNTGTLLWARSTIVGALGGVGLNPRPTDFRNRQSSALQCALGTTVGDPVNEGVIGEQLNVGHRPLNLVIAPNSELMFWQFTVNATLALTVTYRERSVSSSELG